MVMPSLPRPSTTVANYASILSGAISVATIVHNAVAKLIQLGYAVILLLAAGIFLTLVFRAQKRHPRLRRFSIVGILLVMAVSVAATRSQTDGAPPDDLV